MPKTTYEIYIDAHFCTVEDKLLWYSEQEFNEEKQAKERFHKLAFEKEHECEKLRCKIEELTKLI